MSGQCSAVEPQFNEVAGDRPNLFVKWRVRYIEVLFHTFYCNFGRDIEIILFVISRTSLNRGSLNRGSTVQCCNVLQLTLRVKFANTVKPVLSGHSRDPRYCPRNRGVRLVQVHFTGNKRRKLFLTEASVHLIQGVLLIRGPLNTGFTVSGNSRSFLWIF